MLNLLTQKSNFYSFFPFLLSFHGVAVAVSSERDNYVEIKWPNIQPYTMPNFEVIKAHTSMYGTKYDYNSIMHYSSKAFAIDKSEPTIIPLQPAPFMGQRVGKWMMMCNIMLDLLITFRSLFRHLHVWCSAMSEGDVIRLNRMYKCGPPYFSSGMGGSASTEMKQLLNKPASTATAKPPSPSSSSMTQTASEKHKVTEFWGLFLFKITTGN